MKRLNFVKRVLLTIIAVVLFFTSILSSFTVTVYAGANDRSKAWIAMGAENSQESSLGNSEFTYDEMRILGIFLSNYYIPWSTQINNSNDSEADKATKENMITALTDSLNFDQSVAEGLVNAIFDMSVNSARPIYVRQSSGDAFEEGASGKTKCSWANMAIPILSSTFRDENDQPESYTLDYYWIDDSSNEHVIFSYTNGHQNAFAFVLSSIMSQMNVGSGYGTGFLGTSSDFEHAGKMSEDTLNDYLAGFSSDEAILNACALGQQMYIDCFGNIICDNGVGRAFIVVPACLNPYTFIKDSHNAGKAVPVNNLYMMSLSSKGLLVNNQPSNIDNLNLKNLSIKKACPLWTYGRGSKATNWDLAEWNPKKDIGQQYVSSVLSAYDSSDYNFIPNSYFTTNGSNGGEELALFRVISGIGGKHTYWSFGGDYSVIQDWILFDSIGGFNSESTDTMVANEYGIFGKNWGSLTRPPSSSFSTGVDSDNAFNKMTDENSRCVLAGIFASYVFAYFRSDGTVSASESSEEGTSTSTTNDKVKYKINLANLPSGGEGMFTIKLSSDSLDRELKSFMYYILHPSEGTNYIKQWFSKLINSFLIETHEGIVGNTSTNNTTGSSRYLGFSGYVTVPNLHDLSWTQTILNNYDVFFIYVVIFMTLILVGYVFLGSMNIQRALINLILFAFCAYLPPTLINSMVDYTNKVCDSIYGDKFTYWALVQHELYVDSINSVLSQDGASYSDFLLTQFNKQSEYNSNDSTVVALKWLSPKKDNFLLNYRQEIKDVSESSALMNILTDMQRENTSGETYVGDSDSLFLYRSYTDISTYANASYNWAATNGLSTSSFSYKMDGKKTDSGVNLYGELSDSAYFGNRNSEYTLQYATDYGFNYPTQGSSFNSLYCYRVYAPMCGATVPSAIKTGLSNLRLSVTNACGITKMSFNTTVADLNNNSSSVTPDKYHTFVFGEYTESPFYYFSFNLRDQVRYSEPNGLIPLSEHTYKELFLQGDGDYFYNNNSSLVGSNGYGEIRDFMDMRTLFYCVIPYLKMANDTVIEWDEQYGLWLYDGIDLDYSSNYSLSSLSGYSKDSETYYKWWHNVQVSQLFNMYTPWLDKMYECDYAEPVEITVHGERYLVLDPLDPYSYFERDATGSIIAGRCMVFSESEMAYYGLDYSDLTPVEKKIINIQKNSYKDLLVLMDYYTFDDEVLNTAAAMIETFNFNKEFSQTSLFGEDYFLYPQGYELKNFTYDAYLRLILVNATGDSLQLEDEDTGKSVNLYKTILENTSFITGVLMIALDCVATYAIPALKLFFLLAVLVLSLFVIISAVLNIKTNIVSVISDSLVKPLILFSLTSIGMAFVVSMFMSDGNTAVTGRGGYTVSLNDPTMTIIVMLAINIVVTVLYWKICKKAFKDCKKYAEAVFTSIAGTATGIFGKVAGLVAGGTVISRMAKGSAGGVSDAVHRGIQNKANRASYGKGFSRAARQRRAELKAEKSDRKLGKTMVKSENLNNKIANGKSKVNAYQNRVATGTETRFDRTWLGRTVANRRKNSLDRNMKKNDRIDKKLSKRTASSRKANYKAGRRVHSSRVKYSRGKS